ncbi:putative pre-mRNA-splicing factor ATP-dependent RNA helicase prp43 [Colletotrichum sublineola]|uniref:Putative pre-mRNA-splicing factor ATP-dependent RNA helicase prp43 n=1 Tax=Colletotrichum sublineola TaxID=1173701 RepID=A0A066X9A7_COLSU|nr:putative pre-mRNA-splicing factor ATP-dependent RNA helicase prp43 [Colletotrichum sublineola]
MESVLRNQATATKIKLLEDAPQNPLTGNVWPRGHEVILQGRRRLLVYGRYQDILDKYHQSQVIILTSETGLGKSTQVLQLLVYDEYASGLQIGCTQPRRLAATELASRVADEMGVILGEEVGYNIRGDQMVNKNKKKTRLTYLTEGVLLRQLISDRNLSAYACVIIDEAHERTVDLDLLLALLKKVMQRRKDFKVVIMSATMDAKLFQDYFNNCPLVHISGRNFEVKLLYTGPLNAGPSFITLAAGVVAHIHEKEKPVCRLVRLNVKNLDVYPLYSSLSASEQRRALNTSGANRKCIVSTNVAETSLTIDNVVYVVDTGLSKQLIFNPRLRLNMLEVRPISQASARQRAGRAGRTRDGVCYRLYSKEDYDRMPATTEPAICCTSIEKAVLQLIAAGYRKVIDFDWIDAPHPESIARAAQDLRDWGFLKDDAAPTQSGRLAAKCPLDPVWYRAIEAGAKLGCSMNIVDIALLCNSQSSIFLRPPQYRQVADVARTAFAHPLSDHLTLTNAFDAYMQVRRIHQQENPPKFDLGVWCTDHFLNMEALEQVRIARQRLSPFLSDVAKIPPTSASVMDTTSVRKALAIAFHTHSAIHHTGDEYRTVHENTPALLSPLSFLVGANYEWIVYTNFHMGGGKQYLQIATAIKAEWLVDLPFFQEARMPKTGNGGLRQPNVKSSLDDAKARIESIQGKLAALSIQPNH